MKYSFYRIMLYIFHIHVISLKLTDQPIILHKAICIVTEISRLNK